jgi:hypothetical protein
MASYPVNFNNAPKVPPELEVKIVLVKGDLEVIAALPAVGAEVPVKGPVVIIIGFPSESGGLSIGLAY